MAHAGRDLLLPATIAGADALTSKAAPARELFEVRQVARGEEVLAAATREELATPCGGSPRRTFRSRGCCSAARVGHRACAVVRPAPAVIAL